MHQNVVLHVQIVGVDEYWRVKDIDKRLLEWSKAAFVFEGGGYCRGVLLDVDGDRWGL